MTAFIDYVETAQKAGISGMKARDVESSIREAAKARGLRIKNPPGSIIKTANGSYQVQRNGTLLAITVDEAVEAEIAEVIK